ncbi:TraR/DksA C4-type zinc finger protein [Domibacillus robiginosus]|uniref:TraR/DksA C4-type zinc finger protein n=1 Tax=Domibacillus robiginosus TaxID=1071054 RepID=UPI00067C4307|nr:TraR/DksA C4-type zinc finger protein [Domibacillus robiginosus]
MLTKDQLTQFRTELVNRKKEIEARMEENDQFNIERDFPGSVGELSTYDNHPGDTGTELFEREKDMALSEHARLEQQDINAALEAIEAGTYGVCKVCKKEIPLERLEAVPTTLYCMEDSQERYIPRDRPVEETILAPPFGQFDFDDKSENVAYDAEDSWQDVAQYGTSESPSDFMNPPEEYGDMYMESQENKGYVEDYENFAAVDIHGNKVDVYPNREHELYEEVLDDEELMSSLGDLPPSEKEPYTDRK